MKTRIIIELEGKEEIRRFTDALVDQNSLLDMNVAALELLKEGDNDLSGMDISDGVDGALQQLLKEDYDSVYDLLANAISIRLK